MERTFRWRYINISTNGKFCLVLSAKSELADLYNYHCTFVYNSTSYRLISACFSCWSCVGINSIFEHRNLIITQGRIVRFKTKLFGKIHWTKQVHIQNTVKNEAPIVSNLSIDANWIDTTAYIPWWIKCYVPLVIVFFLFFCPITFLLSDFSYAYTDE